MLKLFLFLMLFISSISLSFGEEEKSNFELQTVQIDNKTFNIIVKSDVNIAQPTNRIIISNFTNPNIIQNNDVNGKIYNVNNGDILISSATLVGLFSFGSIYVRTGNLGITNLLAMVIITMLMIVVTLHLFLMMSIVNNSFSVDFFNVVFVITGVGVVTVFSLMMGIQQLSIRLSAMRREAISSFDQILERSRKKE